MADPFGVAQFLRTGPDEHIAGLRAVPVTPVAGSPLTMWKVPEAGCIDARRIAEFRDSAGAVTSRSELIATSIHLGEPPADLFAIPQDYEQVAPSVAYDRLMDLVHGQLTETDRAALRTADADYARNKVTVAEIPTP